MIEHLCSADVNKVFPGRYVNLNKNRSTAKKMEWLVDVTRSVEGSIH